MIKETSEMEEYWEMIGRRLPVESWPLVGTGCTPACSNPSGQQSPHQVHQGGE